MKSEKRKTVVGWIWAIVKNMPRFVWFVTFSGGMLLPGLWGKAFASLAGIILSLYVIDMARGMKKYVLALIFPIVGCIVMRFASGYIYLLSIDVEARKAMWRKIITVVEVFLHYCYRLIETLKGGLSLGSILANVQFVLIFVGIGVCLIYSFSRKNA
jgi:hypothetical protein